MLSCLRSVFCGLAIGALAYGGALAQVPLTNVEGSHLECPDANIGDCATKLEKKLVDNHPGIIRRNSEGRMSVRLLNGHWLESKNECASCDYALDLPQAARYLAIMSFGEEDISWKLLDRQSGAIYAMEGYPLFSPDGKAIASAEQDDMNINALDIYSVTASGPVRVFRGIDPKESWWAEHVCWIDNNTVGFVHAEPRGSYNDGVARTHERATLKKGRWRIEAGGPRFVLTS